MRWTWVVHVWAMRWTCVGHGLDMFWPLLGNIMIVLRTCGEGGEGCGSFQSFMENVLQGWQLPRDGPL